MIELPRACTLADQIAEHADFFSFGTNDLTQTTLGFSRDDIEKRILGRYIDMRILDRSPFETIDEPGVGQLVRMGAWLGRQAKPDLKLGICGEHGGDPDSIAFFALVGPGLRVLLALPGPGGPGRGRAGGRWPRVAASDPIVCHGCYKWRVVLRWQVLLLAWFLWAPLAVGLSALAATVRRALRRAGMGRRPSAPPPIWLTDQEFRLYVPEAGDNVYNDRTPQVQPTLRRSRRATRKFSRGAAFCWKQAHSDGPEIGGHAACRHQTRRHPMVRRDARPSCTRARLI